MAHNYDDLVVITNNCTDYWRFDTEVDEFANKKRGDATSNSFPYTNPGSTPHNLLPAANNLYSNYFNGSSDYITMTASQYATYTYRVSVEAWIRPASDQSASDFIGLVVKSGAFGLCLNYGKLAFFTCLNGGDGTKRLVVDSSAVSADTTYHVVGVYDGQENNHTALYVNGSKVAESYDYSGEVAQNSANLTIGSWDTSVLFFHGALSNVALYGYELTSGQVAADYGYSG